MTFNFGENETRVPTFWKLFKRAKVFVPEGFRYVSQEYDYIKKWIDVSIWLIV